MKNKKEIAELRFDIHDLRMELGRVRDQCRLELRLLRSLVSANCEKAKEVTIQELAQYVLDGTPIVRDKKTSVYAPEEPSTDGLEESK